MQLPNSDVNGAQLETLLGQSTVTNESRSSGEFSGSIASSGLQAALFSSRANPFVLSLLRTIGTSTGPNTRAFLREATNTINWATITLLAAVTGGPRIPGGVSCEGKLKQAARTHEPETTHVFNWVCNAFRGLKLFSKSKRVCHTFSIFFSYSATF